MEASQAESVVDKLAAVDQMRFTLNLSNCGDFLRD